MCAGVIITIKLQWEVRERGRASHALKLIAVIYRKNSACRRTSGNFLLSSLRCRWCTTRYNWLQSILLEAEGVADSQFNFMAYTVPPSAAAYRTPSFFLLFYIILLHRPFPRLLPAPFKNFSTRHPRNFQITSPFPSSFLKIHPPSTRARLSCTPRRIARWIEHRG